MKTLLRYFLINLAALWITTLVVSGLSYEGGLITLILGGAVFTIINLILVPLIKILLLPLNLLTLGLFAWLTNVIALYALTTVVSGFRLGPFFFEGLTYNGFRIPALEFSTFWAAVLASLLIGIITHFFQWLSH
ncbi:MAG: phage holin family protein [Candidatus Daviesbacteria bacterium]|nr:phage holin family protein [Candidatus Daviesbacteria bacterium]